MTASLARVLRWLHGPWVAPDPAPDLSWLDRKDGLEAHVGGVRECPTCMRARADLYATLRAEGTRYDVQWPDVRAAEAGGWAGGDLAAMAAPADWPPFTGWGEYDIEAEERPVVHYGSVAGCALCAEPVEPHGRHRQTDPADLILADLRDLDGQ